MIFTIWFFSLSITITTSITPRDALYHRDLAILNLTSPLSNTYKLIYTQHNTTKDVTTQRTFSIGGNVGGLPHLEDKSGRFVLAATAGPKWASPVPLPGLQGLITYMSVAPREAPWLSGTTAHRPWSKESPPVCS